MWSHFIGKVQLITLSALAISSFANFPHAAAIEFEPVGASGDAGFRDVCPTGQYLIGAQARTGSWVDQISAKCATANLDGSVGEPWSYLPHRGGVGGSPSEITCGNQIVVGMGLLHTEGNRQVRVITFNCVLPDAVAVRPAGPPDAYGHNIEIGPQVPLFPTTIQTCPDGEAATGLHVRYGRHVNALGLICGPFTRPGTETPPEPSAGGCSGLAGEELAICDAHNVARAKHGVPPLNWSADLAKNAADWVEGCHTSKNSNGDEFFCHQSPVWGCGTDPDYHYNENLSFGYPSRSGQRALDEWYCEIDFYDFDNPDAQGGVTFGCDNNPDEVTAHFTQVVWRGSSQLGCAQNTCSLGGNSGTLWACEYDPPGNFNTGQPGVLEENVPRLLQGFAGHSSGAPASSASSQQTTAIISDVDLYDIPGGVGTVIGILRQGQTFPLIGCREDNWCQVSVGWVWGSFLVRSHSQ